MFRAGDGIGALTIFLRDILSLDNKERSLHLEHQNTLSNDPQTRWEKAQVRKFKKNEYIWDTLGRCTKS